MARARNIKPGFFKNELLGTADPLLSLLFQSMWTQADRAGRLEDRPLRIMAEALPYRFGTEPEALLNWLASAGFIRRYSVGESRFIQIVNFSKHQNPHKQEPPSIIPPEIISDDSNGCSTSEVLPKSIGSRRADSLNLIPDSLNLIPDSLIPNSVVPSELPNSVAGAEKKLRRTAAKKIPGSDQPNKTAPIWEAYATAYSLRYGVEPVRNASVNAKLALYAAKLPASEAPAVAAFFVRHDGAAYVRSKHAVGLLLQDAEGLRTEWATGRTVTASQARIADATAGRGNIFGRLIQEARENEQKQNP